MISGPIGDRLLIFGPKARIGFNIQIDLLPFSERIFTMAIPSVVCPSCQKTLISFLSVKSGMSKMIVESNALSHASGVLCKSCGKNSHIEVYENPGGPAKFVIK